MKLDPNLNEKLQLFMQDHNIILIVVILFLTFCFARLLSNVIQRKIRRTTQSGNYDTTGLIFTQRFVSVVVYLLGFGWALAQIPEFKIIGHSLLAGAGVITLVTGLASQQVLSNIMSGILIVIFKPFKIGDRITVNSMTGTVEDINLRQIVLRDIENNRVILPNALIGGSAVINFNHTDTRVCKVIEVGVAYDTDLSHALSLMADEVIKHSLHIDPRTPEQVTANEPEVISRVTALGDSAISLKVWAWAEDNSTGFILMCDLLKSITERFAKEGIQIPFPQRTLHHIGLGAEV